MKKMLIALLLLSGMASATNNYVVRVPVGATYNDGGVRARPTTDTVRFYGGANGNTLIKTIIYTADSMSTDSSLRTSAYCTTTTPTITMIHSIVYPSGNRDLLSEIWKSDNEHNASGVIYRMYVGIIDTSANPDDTTYPEGSTVTWRYWNSTRDHSSSRTLSLGYKDAGVSLSSPGTNNSIYTIVVTRAGCSSSSETIQIDTIPDFSAGVIGYSFRDTTYLYSLVPTSMAAVYLTMNNFESDYTANVKITASCKKKWNTCSNRWFSMSEQEMGYTDSNGYLEFYLPRSSCIGDSKIDIYASYGGEFSKKLGSFTIPDSTSYELKGE